MPADRGRLSGPGLDTAPAVVAPGSLTDQAGAALTAGDWLGARELLDKGLAGGGGPQLLAMLGGLCLADDDMEAARDHWESAFRSFREAGELPAAVRMAAELAMLHTTVWGNRSVASGWIEHGRRLLRQVGRCVEAGYLALAVLGCDRPDATAVARDAQVALDLALEFADRDLEARALAESGYSLVVAGRLGDGFARLDEAMAMVTAGEVGELSVAGRCFCSMLSACDRSGETRRAREWTAVVAEFVARHGDRPRILHTHCRAAYGSLLCSIGRWTEAEKVMVEALAPGSSRAIVHRAEISARLAELRIMQGRLEEADLLLAPFEDVVSCCAPLARLAVARGNPDLAVAIAQRGLSELRGDRVRAIPLLAVKVEAHVTLGELERAADATAELSDLAGAVENPALRAEADLALARVQVARGELAAAVESLDRAQRQLSDQERPVLSGLVRLEQAQVWEEIGDRPRAVAEARAAKAVFAGMGADRFVDRALALSRRLGDHQRLARAEGTLSALTSREQEVLGLLRQGLSNHEIGERLYISAKTAEHHVGRVLTKLGVRSRAEAAAVATSASFWGAEK